MIDTIAPEYAGSSSAVIPAVIPQVALSRYFGIIPLDASGTGVNLPTVAVLTGGVLGLEFQRPG